VTAVRGVVLEKRGLRTPTTPARPAAGRSRWLGLDIQRIDATAFVQFPIAEQIRVQRMPAGDGVGHQVADLRRRKGRVPDGDLVDPASNRDPR